MQKKLMIITFGIALLLMFTVTLNLFNNIKDLRDRNAKLSYDVVELQNSLTLLNIEKQVMRGQLNQQIINFDNLSARHTDLLKSYNDLNKDYNAVSREIDQTIDKITVFEQELNSSMAWFNANSLPVNIPNEKRIQNTLNGRCWEISDDVCTVRLGCFYLINLKKLGLHYKYDTVTSDAADKLQSLGEFMHNWGGDCEDYSMFFKAEYNYIQNECFERGGESIELEAWIPGSGDYFLDFPEEWYLSEADAYELPAGHIHPSVVCGDLYDPNSGAVSGHCVMAYSARPLDRLENMDHLEGASLVESQNGQYLGQVGSYAGIAPTSSQSSIWLIITNNDLWLHSEDSGWIGYESMLEEISQEKMEIEVLV